jgi:MYXO-CTERM domain-containing protein
MNTRSIRFITASWAVPFLLSAACGTEKGAPPGGRESPSSSQADPVVAPPAAKRARATTVAAPNLKPLLGVSGFAPTRALRVARGERVRFDLLSPSFRSFVDAAIGEFIVRPADGSQHAVSADAPEFEFTVPGPALVMACVGAKANERRSDGWQYASHCTKLVVQVDGASDADFRPNDGIVNKTGAPIEILPVVSPEAISLGSDLPVRVYHRGAGQAGARIEAHRPDGSVDVQLSRDGGFADFRIAQAGRWVLRFSKTSELGAQTAELVFDVETEPTFAIAPAGRPVSPKLRHAVWQEFGPAPLGNNNSGRINAIVVDPTNADTVYVGAASGGVWKWQANAWTPLTDNMPVMTVGALAMDPTNPNILYAGTGDSRACSSCYYGVGLYKTTDGGQNWTILGADAFAGRTFAKIVVSPTNPQTVIAATMRSGGREFVAGRGHPGTNGPVGIFRSLDGGATFTQLLNGLPNAQASDVVMAPGDPNTLYAAIGDPFVATDNGVFKSTNGGDSWTKLAGGLPASIGRTVLGVAPSRAQRVYAWITNSGGPNRDLATTRGLFKSDDSGASWTEHNPGAIHNTQGWYDHAIAVHPTSPDTVIIGGVNAVRTMNGGTSFTSVTPPHVDQQFYAFATDGTLYAGDDGGIQRSTTNGSNWTSINAGLGVMQIYSGTSLHPTDQSFVLAGFQDNGSNLRTGSGWRSVLGADGGYTGLHPKQPSVMFIESQNAANLYRSTNGGTSFSKVGTGIATADRVAFLATYEINPQNPQEMLYATHRIWRSTNQGTSFTAISGDVTTGGTERIRAIQIAESNPQTVYIATSDGRIQVSLDGGATFAPKLTGLPKVYLLSREIDIAAWDDRVAVVGVSAFGTDQVRITRDRGASWKTIDGDLPDIPVNTVEISQIEGVEMIFIGTDQGVFSTCNEGQSWRRLGTGIPNVVVTDIRHDATFQRIVATTFGRGMWTIAQPSAAECSGGTGGTGGAGGSAGAGGNGGGGMAGASGAGGSGTTGGSGGAGGIGGGGSSGAGGLAGSAGTGGVGGAGGFDGGAGTGGIGGMAGSGATGGAGGAAGSAGAGAAGRDAGATDAGGSIDAGGSGSGGASGSAGTSGAGGAAGLGAAGGMNPPGSTGATGGAPPSNTGDSDGGCGCRMAPATSTSSVWLGLLVALAFARRRLRREDPAAPLS